MKQAIDPNSIGDKSVAWLTQFVRDQIKLAEGGAVAQGPPPVITSFTPSSAAEGATVTVTGQGFTFVKSVEVNGTNVASFNVVSDTSLTFVQPGDATTGLITVTNLGGSTDSATNLTFTAPSAGVTMISDTITGSDTAINAITPTDTGLSVSIPSAGTYVIDIHLIFQGAGNTTTGHGLCLAYSGSNTVQSIYFDNPSGPQWGYSLTDGSVDQMCLQGPPVLNQDYPLKGHGVLVCSGTGTLKLQGQTEVVNHTFTIRIGSVMRVIKIL